MDDVARILAMERDGQLTPEQQQRLYQARQNGSFTDQPLQAHDTPGRIAGDVVQKIGDVATLGYGNQIGSGLVAAAQKAGDVITGSKNAPSLADRYARLRDEGIREEERFDQQHPVLSGAATLGGLLTPTGEEALVNKGTQALSKVASDLVSRYAPAAVRGAADASAYGHGERLKEESLSGKPVGEDAYNAALFGAIAGPLGESAGKLASKTASSVINGLKGISKSDDASVIKFLSKAIGKRDPEAMEMELQDAHRLGKPYTLADALGVYGKGSLQGLRLNAKLEDQAPMEQFLMQRAQERPERLKQDFAQHLGNYGAQSPEDLESRLEEQRMKIAKPLYEKAYGDTSFSPSGRHIADLKDPRYEQYINEGRALQNRFEKNVEKMGGKAPEQNQYMADLHHIIQGLSEDSEKAYKQEKNRLGALLNTERKDISDKLEQDSPAFAHAQSEYEKHSKALDLFSKTKNLLLEHPDTVKSLITTPEALEAARMRAASDIQAMIGKAGADWTNIQKPVFSSGNAKANLSLLAKDPDDLLKKLEQETRMMRTESILAGSQTATNEANKLRIGSMIHSLPSAALHALGKMTGGPSQDTLKKASEKLLETSAPENIKNVEKLAGAGKEGAFSKRLRDLVRKSTPRIAGNAVQEDSGEVRE